MPLHLKGGDRVRYVGEKCNLDPNDPTMKLEPLMLGAIEHHEPLELGECFLYPVRFDKFIDYAASVQVLDWYLVPMSQKHYVPNAETRKAIRDVNEGRDLTTYDSLEDFRKSLFED